MSELKAGILGGSGYTGIELLRLLAAHPHARIARISSRAHAGRSVGEVFASLRGVVDLEFSEPQDANWEECDVVFCATPSGVAMKHAEQLLQANCKVIDLSADFRLRDAAVWEKWYGARHACPHLLAQAVYGLPETRREQIRGARLVANPGCYPTAVQLGFLPLIENALVDTATLIADAKSGISGAGRGASVTTSFCEAGDSFKAYAVDGHRHLPEIMQELQCVAGGEIGLLFTPHLLPVIRGIHATLYARLRKKVSPRKLQELYEQRYAGEQFVDVLPPNSHPDTRSVRGSNLCRLAVHVPQGGDTVVVLSVEDNLVKGAAGQAVQNMNLMFGLPENAGLQHAPLAP